MEVVYFSLRFMSTFNLNYSEFSNGCVFDCIMRIYDGEHFSKGMGNTMRSVRMLHETDKATFA